MQPCHSLDDYLSHDLVGDRHASFAAHLVDCENCRQAVREQQRLGLLLTEASARLEPVPAELVCRIRLRLRTSRRRRIIDVAAGLAALVVFGWVLERIVSPSTERGMVIAENHPEKHATDSPQPVDRVGITFPARSPMLTVPETIDAENVTFVWVYPGLRESHRTAVVDTDSSLSPERNDP